MRIATIILFLLLAVTPSPQAALQDLSLQFGYNYLLQSDFNKFRYSGDKWIHGYNIQINHSSRRSKLVFISTSMGAVFSGYASEEPIADGQTIIGRNYDLITILGSLNINYDIDKSGSTFVFAGLIYPYSFINHKEYSYDLQNDGSKSNFLKQSSSKMSSGINKRNIGFNVGISKYLTSVFGLDLNMILMLRSLKIWGINGRMVQGGGDTRYESESYVAISGIRFGAYGLEDITRKAYMDLGGITLNFAMSFKNSARGEVSNAN